jgi:hypothetical protein
VPLIFSVVGAASSPPLPPPQATKVATADAVNTNLKVLNMITFFQICKRIYSSLADC